MKKPAASSCQRCGSTVYATKECEAGGFAKLWPGRNLVAVSLRTRKGGVVKFEGPLEDADMEEVNALVAKILGREGGIPE